MIEIKRALISVYDKSGLIELAQCLQSKGVEIISSGGTAIYLEKAGLKVKAVESLTDFPEMLNGRVKTLHPKVHGGILFLRKNTSHQETVQKHDIKPIDLVVVNLYPFEETVAKPNIEFSEAIEQIDIGGPSMIRSAAKNHQSVAVLTSPSQYQTFCDNFLANKVDEKLLKDYATAAFKRTAEYDNAIYSFLNESSSSANTVTELKLTAVQSLRYGENPHQQATLYKVNNTNIGNTGLDAFKQLSGKELSYNNWLDIDAAWALINEFEAEIPACAIIKHNSPCGVALGKTIEEAYDFALEADPISAFGGIVSFNQEIDANTANKLSKMFLEVIIAPSFTSEALETLQQKKNLRLLEAPILPKQNKYKQYRTILGNGLLEQDADHILIDEEMKVVTEVKPEKEDWLGALFAFRVCKHVRSNAIVIVNGNRTVGICGGQTNRVNSVKIALEQASDLATGAILASDGFFPFADNVDYAAQGRIKCLIQPGGSIRDEEVIAAANKYKIPMIFTGMRHFKH